MPHEIKTIDDELSKIKYQRENPPKYILSQYMKEYVSALDELITLLQNRRNRCAQQLEALKSFIAAVPDDKRFLFQLRFEKGLSWVQISMQTINGGCYYSEPNAKNTVYRYIKERGDRA